ncbi:MAG: TasA family protein, partial [Firmicutes bacterium]|nr:TasA family protein [Bacillota bacterium]
MNLKTRIALLSATGLLSVSALAGYGTYAMFTAQSTNSNNTFTAGTLSITQERDDIPQVGPMFYTSSTGAQTGAVPTGLWAPGDQHTRGLFLENNGTLSARLTTLSAFPADSSGNALTSTSTDSTDYNNDLLFAKQSNVRIWQLVAVNPSSVNPSDPDCFLAGESSTQIEQAVDWVNELYTSWLRANPSKNLSSPACQQELLDWVNQNLLQKVNDISATTAAGQTVTSDSVQVVQMVDEPLDSLVNNSINVSSLGDVIKPKQSSLLAFTVGFNKEAPSSLLSEFGSQTAANNSMQGKSVYFNFGTNWVQTRNNPNTIAGMEAGTVYSDSYLSSSTSTSPATSGIWNVSDAGSGAVNGVPLVFSSQVYDSTGTLNVSFNTDDVSELYVDGVPQWVE